MKLLKPFLEKKAKLAVDAWGADSKRVAHIFDPIERWMLDAVSCRDWEIDEPHSQGFQAPNLDRMYPSTWNARKHVRRVLRETLLSEALTEEYASYFAKLSDQELEEAAASFKFENCVQREELNEAIRPKDLKV